MTILVVKCFHWIGFHLVNHLLEKGEVVDGIDVMDSDLKEHLAMFFGRNAHFKLVRDAEKSQYDTCIIIGASDSDRVNAKQYIQIGQRNEQTNDEKLLAIQPPILFGEWMPMNDKGLYMEKQFIRFDSEEFLTSAIYIDDFVSSFFQGLKGSIDPALPEAKSEKDTENKAVKLEKLVHLRDNRPIEKNLTKVLNHYQRFNQLYEGN